MHFEEREQMMKLKFSKENLNFLKNISSYITGQEGKEIYYVNEHNIYVKKKNVDSFHKITLDSLLISYLQNNL